AKEREAFWKSAYDAFKQISENVDLARGGGRRVIRSQIREQRTEAEGLIAKALNGDQDAVQRLQTLLPQMLQEIQQGFAPGSAAGASYYDFIKSTADTLKDKFKTSADIAHQDVLDTQAKIKEFTDGI